MAAELAAAREAQEMLAYADAAAHYEAALGARGAQGSHRAEILLALGAARDRAGAGRRRGGVREVVGIARDDA